MSEKDREDRKDEIKVLKITMYWNEDENNDIIEVWKRRIYVKTKRNNTRSNRRVYL
jgi:hypothetical protein